MAPKKKKISSKEIFEKSGPTHITSVNWDCLHDRRSVAASLVQGAYVLELDRQNKRSGLDAQAPPWWEKFNFQLIDTLIDNTDSSIFGAIYKLADPKDSHHDTANTPEYVDSHHNTANTLEYVDSHHNTANTPEYVDSHHNTANTPEYVVAFRGTITKKKSFTRDARLDLRIMRHCLHQTSRFVTAMQAVESLTLDTEHNVWIAGHSLGAAMATLAGKNMAKLGIHLKAFLFNPPFISSPVDKVKGEKVREVMRIAGSYVTAALTVAMKGRGFNGSFSTFASWVPNMFINPDDHICAAYIGYFEHRKKMVEIGAVRVGQLATENSVRDLLRSAVGKESEPLHLLPSASVTVNLSPSTGFRVAHGIHQWWRPDLDLQFKEYHYDVE